MKKLLLGLYLVVSSFVYSYVNIYPLTFDKRIDGIGEVEEYQLYNGTNSTIRYVFTIAKTKDEKDMSKWIEFYPKTLSLKPGKEGIVKIFIKAPKGTEAGEYTAIFGVKEMPAPSEKDMRENKGSSIKILTNLKITIAGYIGEIEPKIVEERVFLTKDEGKLDFQGEVRNIGQRRGTFSFYLSDSKEKKLFYMGQKRLLKDEKIELKEFNQEIKEREILKNIKSFNTILIKENDKVVKKIKI